MRTTAPRNATTPPQLRRVRLQLAGALTSGALILVACGGGGESGGNDTPQSSKAVRAAALSLQQAMDSSARSIDAVRSTRDSLERLAASVGPAIAQTSDVIGLLTPQAADAGTERSLLTAARDQRSFLQFTVDATRSRSRRAASSGISRARSAGRRASEAYSDLAQQNTELAGLLPASTTFNSGRLRDAVQTVNRRRKPSSSKNTPPGAPPPPPPATPSGCGDGLSVNSVTSCPFARNVREAYQNSGGDSAIEVFSPVTGTSYTMSCTSGVPVVCRGGNGAVVYIR